MKLPLFFISDIHLRLTLSEEESARRRQLIDFINHVADKKGTLFIVGDLFDFWFEYKYVMPKAYLDVLTSLYQARLNGVDIYFIPGNHDFWTRDLADGTLFSQVYSDGLIIEEEGKKLLITHGDGLLSWDKGYRVFRRVVRNRLFTWFYRWLHPDLGYAVARWMSRTGRHPVHTEEYNKRVLTELMEYAGEQCNGNFDYVIIGHYHQAKQVNVGGGELVILGDWVNYHSFGYFDGNQFSLNYWR